MFRICAVAIMGLFTALIASSIAAEDQANHQAPYPIEVEILYSKGVGLMPMLLVTDQIDGYIAWQPYASMAEECGVGHLVCLSHDLPPNGKWRDHPCCVFVASENLIKDHIDIVSAFCALNIYANQYIKDNPAESEEIAARWLMGGSNFTFGDVLVSSRNLIHRASPTLKFSADPSEGWKAAASIFIDRQEEISDLQNYTEAQSSNDSRFFDFEPHEDAKAIINRSSVIVPRPMDEPLGLGCLTGDQHSEPLFIAVKRWQYFNNTYGIALKPQDEAAYRPSAADLIVNGRKVAEFKLITAPAGAQLMTLMEQGCIHLAYVGIAPAIEAIRLGAEVRIIQPVQNEGSGLAVSADSHAHDWGGFVSWAKERSSEGRPLRIADPQAGSIQDFLLRYALKESGLRAVPAPEP